MPKYIAASVRHRIIEIAVAHGFNVQLKPNGDDRYVKILTFYSKPLNQTIYIHKDIAVGAGGIPAYFHIAVHPNFFNKNWGAVTEGIEEIFNRRKKKNLHSSSNYKKFPIFPENNEPCGMSFKVADYDALNLLFQRMVNSGDCIKADAIELTSPKTGDKKTIQKIPNAPSAVNTTTLYTRKQEILPSTDIPTKGLIIKSPFIEKILDGLKTWEMRSSSTQIRGPIALIKKGSGQIVGIANLVDVKGPLTRQDKLEAIDKHQISLERLESGETDKWNTAWVLESAKPLEVPINYQHPNGAIIWVNLDQQTQSQLNNSLK